MSTPVENKIYVIDAVVGQPGWAKLSNTSKKVELTYNPAHDIAQLSQTMSDIIACANKFHKTAWSGTLTVGYSNGEVWEWYPEIHVTSDDEQNFLQDKAILTRKLESLRELDLQKTFTLSVEISAH